ncbi:MAG: serine protease [Verrucomicrobia bacterium]|nr:serine protease [Verrucomicrobiota bacterium]
MKEKPSPERLLFEMFAPGVAYVAVESATGDKGIGTCFHIGDNVFITARHVVEGCQITKIATTNAGIKQSGGSYSTTYFAGEATRIRGPYFHSNENYDLAALRIDGINAPQIPFLHVLDDLFDNKLLLRTVVVMGFPPIPGSRLPVLVCARAEVNASFNTYFDDQRVYVVSCLARGGFSGGPALTPPHHCLGVVTRAMLKGSLPEELGFMAVVGPLPILELLDQHQIMPEYLREELWKPYTQQIT